MGTNFYAVYRGRATGVFTTWNECQEQVKGFSKPIFRKFATFEEADAFSRTGKNITAGTAGEERIAQTATYTRKRARDDDNDSISNERPANFSKIDHSPKKTNIIVASKYNSSKHGPAKVVYTDGASSNNGKVGARAGYGVYWGDNDPRNASVRLSGDRQTNQRAETMAILHAIEQDLKSEETLEIRTDSMYAINGLTNWCIKWQEKDWILSNGKLVENRDIFEKTLNMIEKRKGKVVFTHVAGHQGIKGNEEADMLAVHGATLPLKK